jgi:hypothetical protein
MAAKKRSSSKRANNKRPADRSNEGMPMRAQKREVKKLLAVIKDDAKGIDLRIQQVLGIVESMDFRDS